MKYLELPDVQTPCPYLPERVFISENYLLPAPAPQHLDYLLSCGFRHFGSYFFRPVCGSCTMCVPLRVPIDRYALSRSARRALSRNRDLRTVVGVPAPSKRTYYLYRNHQSRFDRKGSDSYDRYVESFFAPTFGNTQISVYDGNTLISVLHVDITGTAASAVYCYFDTSYESRSLGTFTILKGLEIAGKLNLHRYYLGFLVEGNSHMSYKSRYRPNEILTGEGWLPYLDESGEQSSQDPLKKGFPGAVIRTTHPFHDVFSL